MANEGYTKEQLLTELAQLQAERIHERAHEINTPIGVSLTAITALEQKVLDVNRDFAQGQIKKSQLEEFLKAAGEYCAILANNLQRAGDLVQSFKKVAVDRSTEVRQEFDVRAELDEVLLSVSPQLRPTGHTIEVESESGVVINSYPGDFSQVVTNLVMNSLIHAYEGDDEGQLRFEIAHNGETVSIIYSDDGKGIDPEIQDQIFDPFFTTQRGRYRAGSAHRLQHRGAETRRHHPLRE